VLHGRDGVSKAVQVEGLFGKGIQQQNYRKDPVLGMIRAKQFVVNPHLKAHAGTPGTG
jgi:hypothetical protein